MDDTNFVYDEVEGVVKPEFKTHTEHASLEQILDIAKNIWGKVKSSGVDPKNDKGNDNLLAELQKEFKDFNSSFPLILRWIVQARKYSQSALRKYLLKHAHADISSREKLLDLQAEYLVYIYREEQPRAPTRTIHAYRAQLIKLLRDEDKEFLKLNEQAEKEVEEFNDAIDKERRQEILRRIELMRNN